MPWLTKRWIAFFIFSALVGAALVAVTGFENNQQANKRRNQLNSFGTDPKSDISAPNFGTNWTDANQILVIVVTINSFDANAKTGPAVAATLNFDPIQNQTTSNLGVSISLSVQQKTSNFSVNQLVPDQSITVNAPGDPNNYPFDLYDATLIISASNQITGDDIPITLFTEGDFQGYTYVPQFRSLSNDGGSVAIDFIVKRSTTTEVFAVIIFVLMWCLSVSVFIAAMSIWFRGKKAELPLVSISTALLFALPNIRNSQPGVPSPVGTTEDMVGFFWNILLVATSAIFLLVKWILQNARAAPTTERHGTDPENVEKPLLGK